MACHRAHMWPVAQVRIRTQCPSMTAPSLSELVQQPLDLRSGIGTGQLSMTPVLLPLQVMLVKNLAVSRGLVNGARGVVVGFETEGRGK